MTETKEKKTGILKLIGYTPGGLALWLKLRATGKELQVAGACLRCGLCCRQLNLSYRDRWLRRIPDFHRMLEDHPEYSRFHITGKTGGGLLLFECEHITPEGLCGDHDGRPDICRNYPEKDLLFSGGELLPYCGYRFVEAPSFRKMLEKAAKENREPEKEKESDE